MRFEEEQLKAVENILTTKKIDAAYLLKDLAAKRANSACSVLEDDTADVQESAFSELLEEHEFWNQEDVLGKLWDDAKLAIYAVAEEVEK